MCRLCLRTHCKNNNSCSMIINMRERYQHEHQMVSEWHSKLQNEKCVIFSHSPLNLEMGQSHWNKAEHVQFYWGHQYADFGNGSRSMKQGWTRSILLRPSICWLWKWVKVNETRMNTFNSTETIIMQGYHKQPMQSWHRTVCDFSPYSCFIQQVYIQSFLKLHKFIVSLPYSLLLSHNSDYSFMKEIRSKTQRFH